jgi:streptomycin 6-kinase
VIVSERLRSTVEHSGPGARAWLAGLPSLVQGVVAEWGLELRAQLEHDGYCSVAFHVRTGEGAPAVLKLSLPDEEARFEAAALARWDGDGAIRLYRTSDDGFALLIEPCLPGHDLWTVDVAEQVEVIADLLPRIWRVPLDDDPFPEVSDTVARWVPRMADVARTMDVPEAVAADVRSWARELDQGAPRRLLHGDLHPSNILAAERAPWLAIDPKPWLGDPAFDLAQVLVNWVWVAPTAVGAPERMLRRRAEALADRLGLSTDRVLRWAAVKALGWESGRDAVLALHGAAR